MSYELGKTHKHPGINFTETLNSDNNNNKDFFKDHAPKHNSAHNKLDYQGSLTLDCDEQIFDNQFILPETNNMGNNDSKNTFIQIHDHTLF